MTRRGRSRFTGGRLTLALAGLAGILLSGCARPGGSATEAAICAELRVSLPTWSRADTAETLASGAEFVAVFAAACGG